MKQRHIVNTNRKIRFYLILFISLNILSILICNLFFPADPIFNYFVSKIKKIYNPPDFMYEKNKLNFEFWRKLSSLNNNEIREALNFLFPNVANSHNKANFFEKEFIFDKKMNISDEYVDKHQDWPDKSYTWDPPKNQKVGEYVIPGMKDVQHLIWKHQHPMTCSDKKFITVLPVIGGLGSNLHIIGSALGNAIENNQILIWDEYSYVWEDGPYCKGIISEDQKHYLAGQKKRKRTQIHRNVRTKISNYVGYDCFFAPLTNCTITKWNKNISHGQDLINTRPIPQIIMPIIKRLKIPEYLHYFYWRLCSTAYLVRYNNVSESWMKELEEDYLINPVDEYDVSLYVRHGDKGQEMEIVHDRQYVYALDVIQKILNKKKLNVFLSTEDPKTIEWFVNNTNYSLTYFDFQLGNYNLELASTLGSILTRQMLANLKHSLFSKFVIGTLASNFNRLIQELRMTTAGYANSIYFEVGEHPCVSLEHCRLNGEEFHMNW